MSVLTNKLMLEDTIPHFHILPLFGRFPPRRRRSCCLNIFTFSSSDFTIYWLSCGSIFIYRFVVYAWIIMTALLCSYACKKCSQVTWWYLTSPYVCVLVSSPHMCMSQPASMSYLTSGQDVFRECLVKQMGRAFGVLWGLDLCDPITPVPQGHSWM